jgi:flagellar basal body rod protein FlgC
MSAISSIAAAGMTAATDRFAASAERTAKGDSDLAAEAAVQIASKQSFNASVKVMKVAEEMTKQLLDIKV